MSLLELFWPALLLMLALSLLLVPFGTEVVKRGVIFLDLAVGQWAALGAAVAMLWLHEAEWGLWLGALLGALLAASLVRFLARNANSVALEAPIGLLYALALSVFMLVQANAGSQREVIAALVAYDVLFISAEQALLSLIVALSVAVCAVVPNLQVLGASHLREVMAFLSGAGSLHSADGRVLTRANLPQPDLIEVRGQAMGKRALEIAAAGGHSLLLVGPPGSGKSMLATRMAGILPPLSEAQRLESAAIHSLASLPVEPILAGQLPYQSPHHSASAVALVGGGCHLS